MSDFKYFITDKDGSSLEVFPANEFDDQVFTFDLNAGRLQALASTAALLPDDYLKSYMAGFVEEEKFEEAAVIRDEINSRL